MKPQFYLTNSEHQCPTLRVEGKTGIADPCYIIPTNKWTAFLKSYYDAIGDERKGQPAVFIFEGVPFRLKDTDGDGMFSGVAVDAGLLAEFPLDAAKKTFKFEMIAV